MFCSFPRVKYNTHIAVHTMKSVLTTLTTRIFKNGNCHAVRIPQEFRLDSSQVKISQCPNGDLLIHPLPINRGEVLLAAIYAFDDIQPQPHSRIFSAGIAERIVFRAL